MPSAITTYMALHSERTDDQAVAVSVERIAARLRAVARAGQKVTYNDLAAAVGWDMDDPATAREVAGILRAISSAEHVAGRPLLSVVVVGAKTGRPGKGFFKLAQRLGRYDGAADGTFFAQELRRIHEHWQRAGER